MKKKVDQDIVIVSRKFYLIFLQEYILDQKKLQKKEFKFILFVLDGLKLRWVGIKLLDYLIRSCYTYIFS